MVFVSPELIRLHMVEEPVAEMYRLLQEDEETQTCLKMANIMAVNRLGYNDHGPVHSRIIAGSALEIFRILQDKVDMSVVKDGSGTIEDSRLVVLCGAYLHDIGNAVHRIEHHIHGYEIAKSILDRLLPQMYQQDLEKTIRIRQEILQCIYSSDEAVKCLSVEAGIAKVADGTDMAEGRARIPYKLGKVDIHSMSALAIKKVEIKEGNERPVTIVVYMTNPAGIFQIERVLMKKIETSGIEEHVQVIALINGKEIKSFP